MYIRSVTQKGIYPNICCISGKTGTRISNYGKLSNGDKIQIDNFIMGGKVLRKDYYIENNNMKKSFHKVWDFITNKFKKTNSQYDTLYFKNGELNARI